MMKRKTGQVVSSSVTGEVVSAFLPYSLPPSEPPLVLSSLEALRHDAEKGLSRLELAGDLVPSLDWFVYAFARKEAVLSSQIEGTQASLMDLLKFEAGEIPPEIADDIEEVFNYLAALKYARRQLQDPKGLPLSLRLLNETHRVLMNGVRGASKMPGEVRRSQNWIGGTRPGNALFVPPPPHELPRLLADLEAYMHATDDLPPVVRAGLLHVQFETIHPYLDGNGRIGRLLITLLLEHWGLLRQPLLYLSLYFKRQRQAYYERLNAVRDGDWEGWLSFFLTGIVEVAEEAVSEARSLSALTKRHHDRLLKSSHASVLSIRLLEILPNHPIVSMASVVQHLKVTKPAASKALSVLEELGILVETTGQQRHRSYAYKTYLEHLREGTEVDQ